jgi:hypothetical protein
MRSALAIRAGSFSANRSITSMRRGRVQRHTQPDGGLADQPYRLLYGEVGSRWNWGRGRNAVQAVDDLRTLLVSDWRTLVLIAHGASDLVTPYYDYARPSGRSSPSMAAGTLPRGACAGAAGGRVPAIVIPGRERSSRARTP